MSKEQLGLLNKDNAENILRGISDRTFFKGSISKISSGTTKPVAENTSALVAMHEDYVIASANTTEVPSENMAKVVEIVNKAETEKVVAQKVRQQGGMGI